MSKSKTFLVVSVLAIAATPLLSNNLFPTEYDGGRSRDQVAAEVRNSSAVATMFGEIRTTMSDVLFLKTERYLHSGIAYMPHMNEDRLKDLGTDADQEDVGVGTVIRTPENDFRGPIGHLQRALHPWQDPGKAHIHTAGTELLPWYRVMTMADPRNIRGWTIGGYWLKNHDPEEGLNFLKEGVEKNPEAFQIHYMLGSTYLNEATKLAEPIRHGRRYLEITAKANEAGVDPAIYEEALYAIHSQLLSGLSMIDPPEELAVEAPPSTPFDELEPTTQEALDQLIEERDEYLRLAEQYYHNAAEFGTKQRPDWWTFEEHEHDLRWNHYTEEELRAAVRISAQFEERTNGPKTAIARAEEYNKAFGEEGDPLLRRYINQWKQQLQGAHSH